MINLGMKIITAWMGFACCLGAAEVGRFQMVAGSGGPGVSVILKIDTTTGKTWKFQRVTRFIEPPAVQQLRETVGKIQLKQVPEMNQFTLKEAVSVLNKLARQSGPEGQKVNMILHVPSVGMGVPPGLGVPPGKPIDPLTGKSILPGGGGPLQNIDPNTGLPVQSGGAPGALPGVPGLPVPGGAKPWPRFDPGKTKVRGFVTAINQVSLAQALQMVATASEVPLAVYYEEHAVVLAPAYSGYFRKAVPRREVHEGWVEVGDLPASPRDGTPKRK